MNVSPEPFLSTRETARRVESSEPTLRRAIQSGLLTPDVILVRGRGCRPYCGFRIDRLNEIRAAIK